MRRSILRSTLAAAALAVAAGCSSYRYMRDPTTDLERSRFEYVQNNPGNKYNDDIARGRVRKGMSRLQVRVAWGDPDQVAPQPPNAEFWSYEEGEPSRANAVYQLRFDGEILDDIEIQRSSMHLQNSEERQRRSRRENEGTRAEPTRKPESR